MATAAAQRPKPLSMVQADRLFASGKGRPEQFGMTTPEAVFNALTNVAFGSGASGGIGITAPPQWVGESINKARYRRTISALVNHEDLTSPIVQGYDASNALPTGGTRNLAGGATASGNIQFTAWGPFTTFAWSTGDAFDRTMTDFGIDSNILSSFTARAYEVYSAWVDTHVFDAVLNTTPLASTTPSASLGNLSVQWSALVDGIVKVLPNASPTFALVPVTDLQYMLKNVPPDLVEILDKLLGDDRGEFQLRPDTSGRLTTGQTLVGTRGGLDLYEMPGGGVRVAATNVSIGTTDIGVFGYAYPRYHGDNFFALVQAGS